MKKFLSVFTILSIPVLVHGQSLGQIDNVNNLATRLAGIGNIIIYLLVGLAVIYIVWNIVYYLIRPSSEDRKEVGMNILWGFVGLLIIVSLWGIVNLLVNTFYTNPNVPANRFPNANFFGGTDSPEPTTYPFRESINDGHWGDPDSNTNNSGSKENNWNTGLDPNSSDNTQNYFH